MPKRKERHSQEFDGAGQSIKSIFISLIIVLLAACYCNGFGLIVKKLHIDPNAKMTESTSEKSTEDYKEPEKTTGNVADEERTTEKTDAVEKEGLHLDKDFEPIRLMVTDAVTESVFAQMIPGENGAEDRQLHNGEILTAIAKGTSGGRSYYELEDETYVPVRQKNIVALDSYISLTGYITITYINTTGIKLRSYADFEADNVIGTVYVGDEVTVKAKIRTKDGVEAFMTENGEYITTDNRYFNDFTVTSE